MLFTTYLYWHYAVAPIEILKLLQNYAIATWKKFLIWGHVRTLFYPWHRLHISDVFQPRTYMDRFTNVLVEAYVRLIAATMRLIVICIGLTIEALILAFFIVFFIVWLAWPAFSLLLILKGFQNVF